MQYNRYDNKSYKIYIMLTRTGTLVSNLIYLHTKTPYSHVSISFDKNLDEVYSFGRYNPYNPVYAGFIREDLGDTGVYARFPETSCAIYSLKVTYDEYIKIKKNIGNFKMEAKKYKYNLVGLLGVIVNKPVNRRYHYFCSQFVSKVLNDSNIALFNKDIGLVSPEDFRICEEFELVYEGKLRNYNKERYSDKEIVANANIAQLI